MIGRDFAEFWFLLRTDFHSNWAARMEAAAFGRVKRAGNIALQNCSLAL
jgi:hypothetical protein